MDTEAGVQLAAYGLRHVAELARSLAGATNGIVPVGEVEEVISAGRPCYTFHQMSVSAGDTTRVLVVEAGGRVFALNALAVPGAGEEIRREVAAAQEAFVAGWKEEED